MRKRILPIPLILLIPSVLLVAVIVAGVYRFSLSDEEILAKFPSSHQNHDVIVKTFLNLDANNPWTIQIPQSHAFSLLDTVDESSQAIVGQYDSGVERGKVFVFYRHLQAIGKDYADPKGFVAPFMVSNQGSGLFYYLGLFRWDSQKSRVVLSDSVLLGDRIDLNGVVNIDGKLSVQFKRHSEKQAMAEDPTVSTTLDVQVERGALSLD